VTVATIIGAGDLGGAVAQALAARHSVDRVLIADAAESAARGKALDIQQSGAILGFDTQLQGTGDLRAAAAACRAAAATPSGAGVCIVADRFGPSSSEWRGPEAVRQLAELASHLDGTPVVFAGAAQADLMLDAARDGVLPPTRLIGSCPEALASAVRAIVAMEARCAPGEVMVSVLGAPPAFVIPWSEASIGGYALEQVLTPVQLTRVEARSQRLWPPQAYTLGMAAALVAEGVLRSARRTFSVLAVLDGEFGIRGRIGAVPALLASPGVVHRRVPPLSTRERVQLDTALGTVSR
jgi:malate dehydrogenase